MLLAIAVSALLSSIGLAAGEPAGCHCYRERTYDPLRPGAADGYILATARSSILSAAFGPSKRELVQAVMTGASPDDLFIAHWAAARLGNEASALLETRSVTGSWNAALEGSSGLDARFADALARGAPDRELAAIAIDDTLATRLGVSPAAIAAARGTGAATGDVLLAAVLARRIGTSPTTVLEPIRTRKATWGSALKALGLAPRDLDGVVRALASTRPHPRER
jgi:hypothetical protein